MNKVFLIFGLFVFAYHTGCQLTQGEENIGDLQQTLPSVKELTFIDSLQKEGFSDIKLDIPIPGYTGRGYAFYCIEMKTPFIYTPEKKDSIRSMAHGLANKLYSQIIEDSIIIEVGSIEVTFHTKSMYKHTKRDITFDYKKNDLEISNGFRVVKRINNSYERISWTEEDRRIGKIGLDKQAAIQEEDFKKRNGLK